MFWDWFKKKKEVEPVVTASSTSIRDVLKLNGVSIFKTNILDKSFILPTDEQVLDIVWESGVRHKKYIKGKFECEEFSYDQLSFFLGKGYAFGYSIITVEGMTTHHQINIYINNKGKLKFIEPQTGKPFTGKIKKIYNATIV